MKLWNKWTQASAIAAFFAFGAFACASTGMVETLPKLYSNHADMPAKYGPIVRLSNVKNNSFFCTGFVIDNNYALTAEHCIRGKRKVLINGVTLAKVIGGYYREDFGLIKGDFRQYLKVALSYKTGISMTLKGRTLMACGYPEGAATVTCTYAIGEGPAGFFHAAKGELYPGMSGGPVFDKETNTVVGINSQVNDMHDHLYADRVYFSRTTGIPGAFGIDPDGR